jgi:drug/metabolite transporter (DMT)-like permease
MAVYFIANTASRLLIRVFTQKTKLDPYCASLAIMLPAYLFGMGYGLTQQQQPLLQGVTSSLIGLVLVVGVLQVLSGKISMITQRHIETAPYMVIRMLFVPVSVIASTLFLGESLTSSQLVGMTSILIGVVIVTTGGKLPRLKHVGRYESLTLANSVFLGLYVVFSRYLIEQTSLATLMIVFAAIEMIPLLVTVFLRPLQHPSRFDLALSLGMGATTAIHIVAFWLAVELVGNVALATSISSFRIVTIFMASYLILSERSNPLQKIGGSILATVGLLFS